MSKSVQKSGQKTNAATTPKKPRKSRKEDWETNHILIKEAYTELLTMKRRAPSIQEVADRVGLAYKTVYRHIEEIKLAPQNSPAKLLTEDVFAGIARAAIKGSAANAKLFMQVMYDWIEPGKEKPDAPVDNVDTGPADERRADAIRDLFARLGGDSAGQAAGPDGDVGPESGSAAGGPAESGG